MNNQGVLNPPLHRRALLQAAIGGAAFLGCGMDQADTITPQVRQHAASDGRQVSVWTWQAPKPNGVGVVFFQGAFSSPIKYRRLIEPWAKAGFSVYAPMAVDSTDHADHAKYDRPAVWRTRVEDARIVADLAAASGNGPLISTGHSYGGVTALTLGGVKASMTGSGIEPAADPRVVAIAAFSPPGAAPGLVDAEGYAGLAVPALIQTGTKDVLPGFIDDYRAHLAAFDHGRARPLYGLVLDDVDHYFGGGICRPELPGPMQSAGLDEAIATSLDLFLAFGLKDAVARAHLDKGPERRPTGMLLRHL